MNICKVIERRLGATAGSVRIVEVNGDHIPISHALSANCDIAHHIFAVDSNGRGGSVNGVGVVGVLVKRFISAFKCHSYRHAGWQAVTCHRRECGGVCYAGFCHAVATCVKVRSFKGDTVVARRPLRLQGDVPKSARRDSCRPNLFSTRPSISALARVADIRCCVPIIQGIALSCNGWQGDCAFNGVGCGM